jgi:valyl-tRNA synthetase
MAEIPKAYEPQAVEAKWYGRWLADKIFVANPTSPKPAYSIVIPPPNVTGVLTLGHVLNNTIQDILARRARMLGKEVLWLPGTDHAGIATQTVVERQLRKEEKKTRHDLGREEFVRRVWEWKEKHGGIIIEQLKRLGCSCDWTRERFTMDPAYSAAVARTFVDLYRKGLIYRGRRMVNWDPVALTALSDEEVIPTSQKSSLFYVRYELVDQPGQYLEVATTRPETIMADVALAVHPEDPRYRDSLGKKVWRPLARAEIPIIGDDAIDKDFGTGVLKVTPAHDKLDFEIGARHGLPVIDVLHPNGTINCPELPQLNGLDRFAARKKAAEILTENGLLAREEPHESTVGFSERAGVPIEPRLSDQWFLKYPQVKAARAAVGPGGAIRFRPERWEGVYQHWLEKIQDWCISRQLWWGHRIPVWYAHDDVSKMHVDVEPPPDPENWEQDSDVLDTWFSSWLWPFETMDEETRKKFYPTSDLVTAPDIIFFWVARMIMAGLEYTGKAPFHDVLFTGLIRDSQGRKMSKSLGNSPDPLDLIAKYGADGLRFGLMRIAPSGQDIRYDEKQIEEGRNFANKLWNAVRFRQMQGGESEGEIEPSRLTSDDKWILLRLDAAILGVTTALEGYHFNEAAQALYRFFWSEFCDWYLEASKAHSGDPARKANTLAVIDFVLGHVLRLLHPFMPFITEELWLGLGFHSDLPADQGGKTIQLARWPASLGKDFREHYRLSPNDEEFAEEKYETVTAGRRLRRDFKIASNKKIVFILLPVAELPEEEAEVLRILLNAERLDLPKKYDAPKGTPTALTPLGRLYLPLEGVIDLEAERQRLDKEIAKTEAELVTVRKKLANENFVANAPTAVVEEHRQREKDFAERLEQLQRLCDSLG